VRFHPQAVRRDRAQGQHRDRPLQTQDGARTRHPGRAIARRPCPGQDPHRPYPDLSLVQKRPHRQRFLAKRRAICEGPFRRDRFLRRLPVLPGQDHGQRSSTAGAVIAPSLPSRMDQSDWLAEYHALRESAGILDLSSRSRICLVGNDRVRFLHGQVTNDVKRFRPGEGCYAAIVTAKGKMESDVNIFILQDEVLLDFEPGLTEKITQRLENFIVADDVQIVDAAPHYGLLSVQGPKADDVVEQLGWGERPREPFAIMKINDAVFGEVYVANHRRLFTSCGSRGDEAQIKSGKRKAESGNESESPYVGYYGYDVFVPTSSFVAFKEKLITAVQKIGGCECGERAFETVRIENGIPRFGIDMDETNIPLEAGIESIAFSYNKGCYIGQEVINRIHSIGHVNKELRSLRLADDLKSLPVKGDKLFKDGKEVGYITSAINSPSFGNIALG